MATFSSNQVRQLYVAKALVSDVVSTSTAGDIAVKYDTANSNTYFKYMSPGGQTRSDLIPTAKIVSVKATDADSLKSGLTKYNLSLDSTVNSGAPIAGQDYILRLAFRNFIGLSEEDQYFKYGAVHATSGMTANTFYKTMITSLTKNFSREVAPGLATFALAGAKATVAMSTNSGVTLTARNIGTDGNAITFAVASVSAGAAAVTVTGTAISVSLTGAAKTIADLKAAVVANAAANALVVVTGTNSTTVSAEATPVTLVGGTSTGITIEAVAQEWILGTFEQVPVNFTVIPTTVVSSGDEVVWGVVTTLSPTTYILNGKKTADLEYFAAGEKGDQYRMKGWPNVIRTTYLVDPAVAYNYIDIHYYYEGTGEGVQKSEKDITLVVPKVGATNSVSNVLTNSILTALDTATGLTITKLGTES